MPRQKRPTPPRLLAAVRKFEKWRARKQPRSRIPDELWKVAVELAGEFGVYQTIRALRLDYKSLKRRVSEHTSKDRKPPQFIDVSSCIVPTTVSGCVVDFETESGGKMSVRFASADPETIALLARRFLGGRS